MTERDVARGALDTLRRRVDAHFTAARDRSRDAFSCAADCDQCCHRRFSVFILEAERVREALAALPPPVRARVRRQADDPQHADRCALLVDGQCTVYAQRPLICRTHGLPVADDAGHVSWCPLNYRDHDVPTASVLHLPVLNAPLSVAARMQDGIGARVDLAELARAG